MKIVVKNDNALESVYAESSEWNQLPKQTRKSLQNEYEELRIRFCRLQLIIRNSCLERPCLSEKDFDIRKFKWAYWIVRSRWIDCKDSSSATNKMRKSLKWLQLGSFNDFGALCPYFDMINHSHNNFNVEFWFDEKEKSVNVRTIKSIKEGSEILAFYAEKSDDEYFIDYGQVYIFLHSVYNLYKQEH